MGADVTILETSPDRMRELDDIFLGRVKTVASNPMTLEEGCRRADLLVGAVLIPGAAAPKLVTRHLIGVMKKGAVAVDVAVDQGGCFETTHATTHSDPVYTVDGVIHYCVANMPGAVARTSTFALTNSTLRYALELANKGFVRAVTENARLADGVNTFDGRSPTRRWPRRRKTVYAARHTPPGRARTSRSDPAAAQPGSDSTREDRSAGHGAVTSISSLVTGWRKAILSAWSAWRGNSPRRRFRSGSRTFS
jgi:alanine dehydrogenase